MIFKSKREKQLEELVAIYKAKLDTFGEAEKLIASRYVPIAVPQEGDMVAYWTRISSLISDPLFLFYLTQLRREIVDRFESNGKDNSEFYRGMLTAIGQVFIDARKAQKQITGGQDASI